MLLQRPVLSFRCPADGQTRRGWRRGRIHIVGARLSTCHRACHRGMLFLVKLSNQLSAVCHRRRHRVCWVCWSIPTCEVGYAEHTLLLDSSIKLHCHSCDFQVQKMHHIQTFSIVIMAAQEWLKTSRWWKILVVIGVYCVNCTKFGQLILRKISEIVATRCQILRLKCTKFHFGWGSAPDPAGELTALPQTP